MVSFSHFSLPPDPTPPPEVLVHVHVHEHVHVHVYAWYNVHVHEHTCTYMVHEHSCACTLYMYMHIVYMYIKCTVHTLYMYMYTHLHVHCTVHTCIYTCNTYVYMFTRTMYKCTCSCMCTNVHVHVQCTCVCVQMYMYIHYVPLLYTGGLFGTSEHHPLQAQVPHHVATTTTTGTTIPPNNTQPLPSRSNLRTLTPKYYSKNVSFQYLSDIPSDLLAAVAVCYDYHEIVCRHCFFNSGGRKLTVAKGQRSSTPCSEGHGWRPLLVIPGCHLCSNSSHGKHVPILPMPVHMKMSSSSFLICKRSHHQQCYQPVKGTNPWFPHSVEELVIWTIEKEKCM